MRKTAKQMERHLKGLSNHHRIEILLFLDEHNLATLEVITSNIDGNPKTLSEHVRRLNLAGLVNKKSKGKFIVHTFSPYGNLSQFSKGFSGIKMISFRS